MYNHIASNVGVLSPRAIRIRAREFLIELPRSRFVPEVKSMLISAFETPYQEAYNDGNFAEVITMFDENRAWLDTWPDQILNSNAKVTAAGALMEMGMRDRAIELFRTIPPMIAPQYAILGYSLCERNITYDINRLSPDDFTRAMNNAISCENPQLTLQLAMRYTRDRRASLAVQYNIAKILTDDTLKEATLRDIHGQLMANPSATQFDGFEEVFFDVGMLSFRRNDFRGALIPLQRYIDLTQTTTPNRAEAMFSLAQSLNDLGERDSAMQMFQQIVDTMPNSIFRSMANSEVEDNNWRQNLTQ
jgi:tetratricopeptide (TPR) repeat protein